MNSHSSREHSERYYALLKDRMDLPVYKDKENLISMVSSNKVIIVEGQTGSGKTTQIPQFILESGICKKKIACTQPRQLAAINVARRVAEEMDENVGDTVGYSVRFNSKVGPNTKLVYMTDGLLMREFIDSPNLDDYDAIIIDEAHERTVNTDIIIGLLKQLVERRDDLHIVIMSATLEATKFIEYFGSVPHIKIPGRTFKVDIIYVDEPVGGYLKEAANKVTQIHVEEDEGDILLFLTGEEEIRNCCGLISDMISRNKQKLGRNDLLEPLILPLYASLNYEEQQKVFQKTPPGTRKIVVSTNIAETSVTIDGIVYVVDPGYIKRDHYDPERRMSKLIVTTISQAAANQRAGRAGRTRDGKCYRLYTESHYKSKLSSQTVPEILTTDLADVILTMLSIGIKDIVNFPFLDTPSKKQMLAAVEHLYFLGIITIKGELTEIGRKVAMLPIEPNLGKALVCSYRFGCSDEVLSLVSILSEKGKPIFERPSKNKREEASRKHDELKSKYGDHITILDTFEIYLKLPFKERIGWCKNYFINFKLLERADKNRKQIQGILKRIGVPLKNLKNCNYEERSISVIKALLQGLFMQVAMFNPERNSYSFLFTQREAVIQNDSVYFDKNPECIMYSTYIFTREDKLINVSKIQPAWLFAVSPDYFDSKNFDDGFMKRELFEKIMKKLKRGNR